jgi:hypothetical protein
VVSPVVSEVGQLHPRPPAAVTTPALPEIDRKIHRRSRRKLHHVRGRYPSTGRCTRLQPRRSLGAFETSEWGLKYPAIGMAWRRVWNEVIPFFAFPKDVRRLIYTTNAIEALNSKLRRAIRARGHFPTDEAAMKLLFLVLNRSEKEWTMPACEWCMAKAQFAVMFGERFSKAAD